MGFALLAALFCTMLNVAVPGLWVMLASWLWWGLFWRGYYPRRSASNGKLRTKAEILAMAASVFSLYALTNPRMLQLLFVPIALVLWTWCFATWRASRKSSLIIR